jgi:hypothetical protein
VATTKFLGNKAAIPPIALYQGNPTLGDFIHRTTGLHQGVSLLGFS